jgi:hypothetical protein
LPCDKLPETDASTVDSPPTEKNETTVYIYGSTALSVESFNLASQK